VVFLSLGYYKMLKAIKILHVFETECCSRSDIASWVYRVWYMMVVHLYACIASITQAP